MEQESKLEGCEGYGARARWCEMTCQHGNNGLAALIHHTSASYTAVQSE